MRHPFTRRAWSIAAALAFAAAFVVVYAINTHPTYLDAYYHANAAGRLAAGQGLTDTAIWVYLGLPPDLTQPVTETPSHLYWMPATSLLSGASMAIFGASYAAARLPMALCFAGAILIAVLAGGWVGGRRRHAVLAGVLMVLSGSFADKWGEIDTFAPYALFAAGALAAIVRGQESGRLRWWFAAGLLGGASHLTRSDGLLLPIVGIMVILWRGEKRLHALALLLAGYLLIMTPWFLRMIDAVGAPLPIGGLQTAFLREYLEIFAYPWRDLGLASVGIGPLIQARIDALGPNLATFFVSEGWLIVWPLFLWGLFRAPSSIRLPVGLFALGLHAAMIFVFAWPGANGGLLHGAAGLMPWWAALTGPGIDALARAVAPRPRHVPLAAGILTALVIGMALFATSARFRPAPEPEIIALLAPHLTPADRVLSTDPTRLYYHLGIGGVVLPYTDIDDLPELARAFAIDYLVLDEIETDGDGLRATAPPQLYPILTETPPFLELVADFGSARLYRFR